MRAEMVRLRLKREPERLRGAHQHQDLALAQAQRAPRIELAGRNGFERAAVDLALVGGVVETEAEQRGHERRELDERREAEVEDEELEQERRAADQLHPRREQDAKRRRSIDT